MDTLELIVAAIVVIEHLLAFIFRKGIARKVLFTKDGQRKDAPKRASVRTDIP